MSLTGRNSLHWNVTISKADREQDAVKALKLMMEEFGDDRCSGLEVDADQEPYKAILATTWRELSEGGLVRDLGWNRYNLTPSGWLRGTELLGLPSQEAFRNQMSKLSACLKSYAKANDRREDAVVEIDTIVNDCGLPESFIRNAVASGLLDSVFNIRGAYFAPDDENQNFIVIPINYGHRRT